MVTDKPRGRAALKVRTGLFIKEWLEKVGEDSISGMHSAYKGRMWMEVNQFRPKKERVGVCTYENFVKYFGRLRRMGMVEFVRDEPTEWAPPGLLSIRDKTVVASTRRIYRISDLGRSEELAAVWGDPLMRRLFKEAVVRK